MEKIKNILQKGSFLIILGLVVIVFLFTQSTLLFLIINVIIIVYLYIIINIYYQEIKIKEYIKEKMSIAKKDITNIDDLLILIIKDENIIWANEIALEEFPHLRRDRNMNFLIQNEEELDDENYIKYNNQIYDILEKGEIYTLVKNTNNFREKNKYRNLQTIIGYFQIDNLKSLSTTMDSKKYLEFISDFKKELLDIFISSRIFFQELEDEVYYLNIPKKELEKGIESRFKILGDLIKKYHTQGILVTTSMGIAYNYEEIDETGNKAREAYDLAISRGGAQIVIFNNGEKLYFGGGNTISQGSTRLRARIIANTLLRLIDQKETIYLGTHKNPDDDAIGSLLLMYQFVKTKQNNVKILIDSVESIQKYDLDTLDFREDIITDYVIDKTKKNILISLDTQSREIFSHINLLEDLEEIVIIDHHQTPINYFRGNLFSWIEPNASSTTELVMSIMTSVNRKNENKFINSQALLGILSDTNRFRYRVGYQTLDALMNLVEQGGDFTEALESLYLTEEMYKQKHKILSQIKFEKHFAVIEIDEIIDDTLLSIVVDDMLEVKEKIGAIIISKLEEQNRYKVKIRTSKKINAKRLIENFGGGGHATQAAGILTEENKNLLLEEITNFKID